MVKINIEVSGNKEDVLSFVGLCSKIELLGLWGANRTIPVDVDGDGSADLRFKIEAEVENEGTVDLIDEWWKHNRDKFNEEVDNNKIKTHYIGE